jgi:hypothetical protein
MMLVSNVVGMGLLLLLVSLLLVCLRGGGEEGEVELGQDLSCQLMEAGLLG